jgi:hypothetical protein
MNMTITQIRLWIQKEIEDDKKCMDDHKAAGRDTLANYYEGRIDGYENILERTGGI